MRSNSKIKRNKQRPDPLAILLAGQKLAKDGNVNKALRLFGRGLSIAKETRNKRVQSLIHSEMGLCYQAKGQATNALREFAKAYRVTSRSSTCLLILGTSYLERGDLENAGRYLARALALAEREYRKGRHAKKAINFLNACLLLSKTSRELATKALQLGLKSFPGHPLLKQELQALTG